MSDYLYPDKDKGQMELPCFTKLKMDQGSLETAITILERKRSLIS